MSPPRLMDGVILFGNQSKWGGVKVSATKNVDLMNGTQVQN